MSITVLLMSLCTLYASLKTASAARARVSAIPVQPPHLAGSDFEMPDFYMQTPYCKDQCYAMEPLISKARGVPLIPQPREWAILHPIVND